MPILFFNTFSRITKYSSILIFIRLLRKKKRLSCLSYFKNCQKFKKIQALFAQNKLKRLVRAIVTQHGKKEEEENTPNTFSRMDTPSNVSPTVERTLITSNYPVLHLHAYDHPDRANTQPSRNKLHLITRALIACPHHSAGLYPSPLRRRLVRIAYTARGGSSGSRYLFPRGRKRNGRPQGGIDPPISPPPAPGPGMFIH